MVVPQVREVVGIPICPPCTCCDQRRYTAAPCAARWLSGNDTGLAGPRLTQTNVVFEVAAGVHVSVQPSCSAQQSGCLLETRHNPDPGTLSCSRPEGWWSDAWRCMMQRILPILPVLLRQQALRSWKGGSGGGGGRGGGTSPRRDSTHSWGSIIATL